MGRRPSRFSCVLCVSWCAYLYLVAVFLAAAPRERPELRWGAPTPPEALRAGYIRGHAGHSTAWTLEYLSADTLAGHAKRSSFRADYDVPWEWRPTPADYQGSGFDRGHLAPAADNQADAARMRDCFFLSNMAPQTAALNRGPWKQLEEHLRRIALTGAEVWVVTLPLFLPDPETGTITIRTVGKHRVWVPTHFAKAALFQRGETFSMRAWVMPNDDDPPPYQDCLTAVNTLEAQAAFDLFAGLPDELENELESTIPE